MQTAAAISVLMQSYYAQTRDLRLHTNGDTMFNVLGSNTLILQNIQLIENDNSSAAIIEVAAGGTVSMYIFSVIRYNFIGVAVLNGGTINMFHDSRISNNRMYGVLTHAGGSLLMNEYSVITGNMIGTHITGGATPGRLVMNSNSIISGNVLRGVLTSGKVIMRDRSRIMQNAGGGMFIQGPGSAEMLDFAEISDNHLGLHHGAGVVVRTNATLTMSDDTRIHGNTTLGA